MTTTPTNTRSQGGAEALLPCPFCGGSASLARCGFGTARVTCMDCGSEGKYCQSHADAIAAWNTRSLAAPASAQEALTLAQLNECARAAQVDFALDKATSFEVAFARRIEAAHGIASRAPSAAVQQGESPSEKQKKLMDLADRIDHEQLWRWAGMHHDKMTPEQQDRMNAGVALRRYARLWAPGRWLIFPPVGPVNFSASTLDKVYAMAKKDEDRAALASAQPKTGESNV